MDKLVRVPIKSTIIRYYMCLRTRVRFGTIALSAPQFKFQLSHTHARSLSLSNYFFPSRSLLKKLSSTKYKTHASSDAPLFLFLPYLKPNLSPPLHDA